jgi:hypothetical protein
MAHVAELLAQKCWAAWFKATPPGANRSHALSALSDMTFRAMQHALWHVVWWQAWRPAWQLGGQHGQHRQSDGGPP